VSQREMNMKRTSISIALLLALVACDEMDGTTAAEGPTRDAGDERVSGDASASHDAGPAPGSDAAVDDAPLIPLIVWVDDLVDHRTNDSAPPDTVEDKRIQETEDPALFNKYFP
jgi:hypothetical protein